MPYLAPRPVEGGSAPVLTPEEEALLAAEGEAIPPPAQPAGYRPPDAYETGPAPQQAVQPDGALGFLNEPTGDPAVMYAQSQQTNPIPAPAPASASGSPYTSGSSALYGAGAVDTFNGGYPVTGGTQPMGFDPDPTTVLPPPTANTGGGASTYYGGTNSARKLGQAVPNAKEISTLYPASGGPTNLRVIPPPRPNRYNWDAAEPGPPKPMPDSNPVVTPDMQPVEQAMGNVIPGIADTFGQFFGPIPGRPGLGRSNLGDQARRAQDVVGGMILADPEKPQSVAGEAGRQAGQAIAPIIDRAAEGIVGGARNAVLASAGLAPDVADRGLDMVRLSAGVPPKREPDKGLRPTGGVRAVGEQEPIPSPEASIPDRMGSWLQTEVIQPGTQVDPALVAAGDWLSKNVIDPLTTPRERTASPQREPTPPSAYPDMTAQAAGWIGRTTTDEWNTLKASDPASWVAATKQTPVEFEIDGVPRSLKLIESRDVPGIFLGYVDESGNVVPVGGDVSVEQFIELVTANAAEAPPGWGDVATPTKTATTTSETVPAPTSTATGTGQPTTLEDVTWTGDTPSSGGGGSWNDSWDDTWSSGSRSSGRRSSSWDDFDNGFDGGREFTADDFLDAADGDYRKAERMARSANNRRKRKKGQASTGSSGFWDGFPFNRPPSPMREYILTAIQESRAAGAQRQR